MSDDLPRRIEALEARHAIADLIHAYARLVRREAFEDVAALFAPGGTFEVHSGRPNEAETSLRHTYASVGELVGFLAAGRGRPGPVPLVHNLMIELDGDAATANAVMLAQIFGTQTQVLGEYFDRVARIDGRWLFTARKYVVWS